MKPSRVKRKKLKQAGRDAMALSASRNEKEWLDRHYGAGTLRPACFDSISFRPEPALITPESLGSFSYAEKLGFPGEYPFTRGVHASMYRGKLWTMRQFAGYGSPEDTNKRFKYLLEKGQTGLSTAFDMPTLMGYDSDSPKALGEIGREGVNVSSLEDMERLFAGIRLDQVTTSMTINCTATIALAMYVAVALKHNIPLGHVGGTIQNDMLKEFIAQKEWICPPAPSVKLSCDIIEFCSQRAKHFNAISISGYHIREAGATAIQELAFTLADGLAYVDHCIERGMDIDQIGPQLSFFFDVHNNFFEEIAKFRAARRMWARFMRERYGAKAQKTLMLRTHAQTAGVSLCAQQPMNNIMRVTMQALAAVLGGVQSLHTNSMDETLSLPTQEAVKIALRTQQIIAEESGVANVIDPLGGSYYLEHLTDQMEQLALAYIKRIDRMGGMLRAVERGFPQQEIDEAAYEFQRRVEDKRISIVGVNCYRDQEEQEIATHKADPEVERYQIKRIREFKRRRQRRSWQAALQKLRTALKKSANVMPVLIEAVQAGVTLGEASDLYREVYGIYSDSGTI